MILYYLDGDCPPLAEARLPPLDRGFLFGVAAGCAETFLFRDGFPTESTASSLFAVSGGVLLAPPQNSRIR
ncbi:MAG: hypothetical protein LBF61_03735 [Azoarcus sp.]|jgi:branched-subunit amino acid aminotransferase/4-amino-4-deoxychorismate lyase|nr:hypothetical protein [Azoarcus sp.]